MENLKEIEEGILNQENQKKLAMTTKNIHQKKNVLNIFTSKRLKSAEEEKVVGKVEEYNEFIKEYGYWFYDDIKNKKIFEVVIIKAESDNKGELELL